MNVTRLLAVAGAMAAVLVAHGEDYVWNGGASGEWTTPSNWLPDTGYPNDAGDTAAFTPSAATAVTIGSAVTVQGITVSYDKNKPNISPTRTYTFDELLEVTYVTVKAILESGLEKPFVNRGPETVYKD